MSGLRTGPRPPGQASSRRPYQVEGDQVVQGLGDAAATDRCELTAQRRSVLAAELADCCAHRLRVRRRQGIFGSGQSEVALQALNCPQHIEETVVGETRLGVEVADCIVQSGCALETNATAAGVPER